jgi:hypothetical protein
MDMAKLKSRRADTEVIGSKRARGNPGHAAKPEAQKESTGGFEVDNRDLKDLFIYCK